jgi:hypothetical protein
MVALLCREFWGCPGESPQPASPIFLELGKVYTAVRIVFTSVYPLVISDSETVPIEEEIKRASKRKAPLSDRGAERALDSDRYKYLRSLLYTDVSSITHRLYARRMLNQSGPIAVSS